MLLTKLFTAICGFVKMEVHLIAQLMDVKDIIISLMDTGFVIIHRLAVRH
jgi:hypothetical protein